MDPSGAPSVIRGLQDLINADAANSQATFLSDDLLPNSPPERSPTSEPATPHNTPTSQSEILSKSNGVGVFNKNNNDEPIYENLKNVGNGQKNGSRRGSQELSDAVLAKFAKSCTVSGTNTAQKNSFIIDKDLSVKNTEIVSKQDIKIQSRVTKLHQNKRGNGVKEDLAPDAMISSIHSSYREASSFAELRDPKAVPVTKKDPSDEIPSASPQDECIQKKRNSFYQGSSLVRGAPGGDVADVVLLKPCSSVKQNVVASPRSGFNRVYFTHCSLAQVRL